MTATNPVAATDLLNRIPRRVLVISAMVIALTILLIMIELQIEVGRLRRISRPYLAVDNSGPVPDTSAELEKVFAANRAVAATAVPPEVAQEKPAATEVAAGEAFPVPEKIIS